LLPWGKFEGEKLLKIKRRGIFMQLLNEIRGSWFLKLLRSENIFILNMILFFKKKATGVNTC